MSTVTYRLKAAFIPPGATVIEFEGEEGLNRPYHFRITFRMLLADALALDLDAATGQDAEFSIGDDTDVPRYRYHGTVAALEVVVDLVRSSVLRLHLVPKLWRLGLGEHSRVFVDQALPDIIKKTLEDGGLSAPDYELKLNGSYSPLAHVCQYRESRLDFLTRWLERVGAHYFFEQGDAQEKLVITDDKASHEASLGAAVRFSTRGEGDATAGEALQSFRWRREVLPTKVTVGDYNEVHPALAVHGEAGVVPSGDGGEVKLFDVNEPLPAGAAAYAKARAQQYLAGQTTYRAHGLVFGLMPGFTFTLDAHPNQALNQAYLVTAIRHRGSAFTDARPEAELAEHATVRELYRCDVTAVVEAEETWLPPATVAWPHIPGSVRARIDGAATSDYAQLDEHGRYDVRLMLDESALPDGAASKRVRMLQPHAGNPEGFHFPLRKDTEVQVSFLRGDPDQPVIVGVVPNALTASPVTKANRTQNVLQTGGKTRLEIDDNQGLEYIDLSTPPQSTFLHLGALAGLGTHNFALSTHGDYKMHTGANRDVTVVGTQTETVVGDVTENYQSSQTTHVSGALKETIDGGATQTIHAGSTQTIDSGLTQSITGGEGRTVTGGLTETLSGGRTQTIVGSSTETINGALDQTIASGATITSPAGHVVKAASSFVLNSSGHITLIANGGFSVLAPGGQTRLDEFVEDMGKEWSTKTDTSISIAAMKLEVRLGYLEAVGVKVDYFGAKGTTGSKLLQGALAYFGSKMVDHGIFGIYKEYSGAILKG